MTGWWVHGMYICSGLSAWFWLDPNSRTTVAPIAKMIYHELDWEYPEVNGSVSREPQPPEVNESGSSECPEVVCPACLGSDGASAEDVILSANCTQCLLECAHAEKQSDLLSNFADAGWQSSLLMRNVSTFVVETISEKIWPWPTESILVLPNINAEQWGATMTDSLEAGLQQLPVDWRKALRREVQTVGKELNSEAQRLIAALRKRFPEQKFFDAKRDPMSVLAFSVALFPLVAWQLYGLWRLFFFCVRVGCKICCCCCRRGRRAARLDGTWYAAGNEKIEIKAILEHGEAMLKTNDDITVVMVQSGTETSGKLRGDKLHWEGEKVWTRMPEKQPEKQPVNGKESTIGESSESPPSSKKEKGKRVKKGNTSAF